MTSLSAYGEDKKDCSCPKVTCGPCQKKITIGKVVKFCDWGDINVCRKVVCENVNFYFGCLSDHNKKRMTPKKEDEGDLEFAYDQGVKKKEKSQRQVASQDIAHRSKKQKLTAQGRIEVGNDSRVIEGESYSDLIIGEVASTGKGLEVLHRGLRKPALRKQKLFVGDEIYNTTQSPAKLSVIFSQGQVDLKFQKKTKLIVHDPHSIVGRFQPFMYLVYGGVDFDVQMTEGSFDLLAGQILARSSGGKHRMNYVMDAEGLKVKVESLKEPIDVLRAQDLSGKKIKVEAGNFVSWVSETSGDLFTEDEKQALIGEGFITPVFQMPEARRKALGLLPPEPKPQFSDWNKDKGRRQLASVSDDLCQAPAASFQQCAWSCEGNGKNAKDCQAQKNSVHCVRRICNAAGQWGDPTAFASSYRDLCPAQGVRVGDCSP